MNQITQPAAFDIDAIRADFPALSQQVHGKPLAYLDSGASAQKPLQVINAMQSAMMETYSNVHRGVHYLSQKSTELYEEARKKTQNLLNAASDNEIVFTKNTTEAINLVAHSYGSFLNEGDEVIISEMEHHANIVPWQMLRDRKGIVLRIAPVTDDGELDMAAYENLLNRNTKLVAITHTSNVLGTITPMARIIELAHQAGAKVLVDGSQAVVHMAVDVQALDADFYVFTGHKLYGPTGIGVLYGKEDLLNSMPPFLGGGDMIKSVSFDHTEYADAPSRFEAGTPMIVEAVGLGAAIDYVQAIGFDAIEAHEKDLRNYCHQRLLSVPGLKIIGTAANKAAVVSFVVDGAHPHDLGTILDRSGVAVRAGHHCAEPLMHRMGVNATARASFGLYNTRAEIDQLVKAVEFAKDMLG